MSRFIEEQRGRFGVEPVFCCAVNFRYLRVSLNVSSCSIERRIL